ncbi:sensor histidine kinase [Flavobacterium sp. H122]|uniref:sensor histidine kinase n=1 Tax=Flavobacterium sp. H122 TaxID=2529860 RepID=UPI0010A9BC9C|nr:ATP-binding protein [Flavobacterium sp. H122]
MKINLLDDREIIEITIISFGAFLLMGLVLVLFFYFSRKKIIQKEMEKKNLELSYQKELLHSIIITQEEERRRIAQDLHDDISSKLNIISLNSHLLTAKNLSEKELTEISINIVNLTTKVLDNSRRIAHDLLPPVLEKFGLHAGVEELCFEINSSKSIEIEYKNSVQFNQKDIQKHLHVFRIIQELFNNSLKHGKATKIQLIFSENNQKQNICEFSDNGVGFDSNDLKNHKGLGMKNIESRISFLNGDLKITSEVNKGIQVVFIF